MYAQRDHASIRAPMSCACRANTRNQYESLKIGLLREDSCSYLQSKWGRKRGVSTVYHQMCNPVEWRLQIHSSSASTLFVWWRWPMQVSWRLWAGGLHMVASFVCLWQEAKRAMDICFNSPTFLQGLTKWAQVSHGPVIRWGKKRLLMLRSFQCTFATIFAKLMGQECRDWSQRYACAETQGAGGCCQVPRVRTKNRVSAVAVWLSKRWRHITWDLVSYISSIQHAVFIVTVVTLLK